MNRRRTAMSATVVVVVAMLSLVTALVVSGPFGLVIAADCLTAVGLIVLLAAVPRGAPETGAQRAPAARAWLNRAMFWRRGTPSPVVQAGDFPAYAKISSDVGWAPVSQWHYDHGVRPLLSRLMQSALAEHHRVDVATDPARAQRLVGDDVWPLIDPSRPPSFDSTAPGTDLRTLARIVERLEQL